jgi:hypothetical protein
MAEITHKSTTGTGTSVGTVRAPRPTKKGTPPAVSLTLTSQQLTADVGGAINSVVTATDALSAQVPASLSRKPTGRSPRGSKGVNPTRALGMVNLLRTYSAKLGPLNVNVNSMEDLATLANNATGMIQKLSAFITLVTNVRNAAMVQLGPDSRIIYRRALSVAETDLTLADALAPFRTPSVKAGKKGASTRRAEENAKSQPPPGAEGAQAHSSITSR